LINCLSVFVPLLRLRISDLCSTICELSPVRAVEKIISNVLNLLIGWTPDHDALNEGRFLGFERGLIRITLAFRRASVTPG
jgi:hypothetical protein